MKELKIRTAKSTGWDHVVIGWSALQYNRVVIEAFTPEMVQCIHIEQHWLMEMAQPDHIYHSQNSRHSSSLSNTVSDILSGDCFFYICLIKD